MIFVTVGGQTPFDRLIAAVDAWCGERGRGADVFAQIGRSELVPRHLRCTRFLAPEEFRAAVRDARVVVAHAGMGTILTVLEFGRPLLVLPRRAALLETRNDHQLATARHFAERAALTVAWDEHELAGWLDRIDVIGAAPVVPPRASEALLAAVRRFVRGD